MASSLSIRPEFIARAVDISEGPKGTSNDRLSIPACLCRRLCARTRISGTRPVLFRKVLVVSLTWGEHQQENVIRGSFF